MVFCYGSPNKDQKGTTEQEDQSRRLIQCPVMKLQITQVVAEINSHQLERKILYLAPEF